MRRRPGIIALVLAALSAGAPTAGAVEVPGCAPPATGGDWPIYGGTFDNHREQTAEKAISTVSVADLGVAWKAAAPDGGQIHSTPTVADGCVFFGTDLGTVYALNADSGAVVWERKLAGGSSSGSNSFQGAGIVGSPAIVDGRVHVGVTASAASLSVALDQATGAVLWDRQIDTDDGGGVDSSPLPFDGMVFQAYQGDESSDHSWPGYAILDAATGDILASEKIIPKADYDAGDRGGSIVNTPAVDLERKLLFAGTGNPASRRQNPRTNSQLKIDINRESPTFGKIIDSVRGTSDSYPAPTDIDSPVCNPDLQWPIGRFTCGSFDFNFLSSGVLYQHTDGRKLFGELQKSGVFQAVDTETMDVVWKATIGVPCLGCNLSSAATDGRTIYVAVTGGNLYALNGDTGTPRWVAPGTGGTRFNGISIANGVVYSTNDAGALQAFDAATGVPLFADPYFRHTDTPMQDLGNSSGITVARNTVFVTSRDPGSTSTLFAYRLGAGGDGGGGLPDPPVEPPGLTGDLQIISGPGASNAGYLSPVWVYTRGSRLIYTNLDPIARHDVEATQKGPDGRPLFDTPLLALRESSPVLGVEKLAAGTYPFKCELHPGMKAQLVVQ